MAKRLDGPYRLAYVRPHHSPALARLFRSALDQDFSYYSDSYLDQTRRQNTAPKLALGSLRPDRMLIGLWSDDSLVGYIIGATRPGEDSGDIFWLYVDPKHRGRGLGADLLMESVGWLQQKGLKSVELVTYDHAEFYKKHNFNLERVAKGFIGGQDVYIMKRSLL
jgi:ribosomal protein S18 acetylase RimI-like enzyme